MEARKYIGIDPGQSGGIAILRWSVTRKTPTIHRLLKMPATEHDIFEVFNTEAVGASTTSIEAVHAMPQQGVSSTFKFGHGYGFLRGCLISCGISFQEVQPRAWQKALGISSRKETESQTQFKNRLKGFAQQRFPSEHITLATCDALLIALYTCLQTEGKL